MKPQRRRRPRVNASGTKRRRRNPMPMTHRRRRRRNPGIGSVIGSPKELVTGAVAGLASAVATRQIPQLVLGTGNTGWEGYAANLVTAIAAAWAAGAFMGPAAGRGALIGGSVIVLDRILSDTISPISSYLALSGVGDAQAYSKLGTIRSGFYAHPGLQNPDGSLYIPDPFNDAAVQAVLQKYPNLAAPIAAASAGGKMGAVRPSALRPHMANGMMLSSRYQGRFNQ